MELFREVSSGPQESRVHPSVVAPAPQGDVQGTFRDRVILHFISTQLQTGQGYDAYDLVCW